MTVKHCLTMKKYGSLCFVVAFVVTFLLFSGGCEAGFTATCRGEDARHGTSFLPSGQFGRLPQPPTGDPFLQRPENPLTTLRAGGEILGSSLTVSALAKICSAFAFMNGAVLSFAPRAAGDMYKVDIGEGTFSSYLTQAIGAVALGQGINLYLAVVKNMSAQKAIGFALLSRLLFLLKSFVLHTNKKLGFRTDFLSLNTAVMSWSTLSLLTGLGNPMIAAKLFSSMALVKGALMFLNPVAGAKKFFGIDITEMTKQRAMCRALGQYLLISAVLMGALAWGIDPVKAAGCSSLVWSFLLFDGAFISRTYKQLDGDPWPQRFILFLAITFSLGFLS